MVHTTLPAPVQYLYCYQYGISQPPLQYSSGSVEQTVAARAQAKLESCLFSYSSSSW